MTNLRHVEPVVDATVAALVARLNTKLDEIVVEKGDGVPLEHVPESAYFPGGLARPPTTWPFVEVSVSDSNLSGGTLGQVAYNSAQANVIVCLWCRHVDDETLYRMMMRYGRAVGAVLTERATYGDDAYVDTIRWAYPRNPETREIDQLSGGVLVFASVVGDEVSG